MSVMRIFIGIVKHIVNVGRLNALLLPTWETSKYRFRQLDMQYNFALTSHRRLAALIFPRRCIFLYPSRVIRFRETRVRVTL